MSDGRIEYNTCGTNGGGVHISGAAMMNVSGSIVIKNNYLTIGSNTNANNVRITDAAYIKKDGALTPDSEIYINPKIYNHALAVSVTEDDMKYFIFDDRNIESSGLKKYCIGDEMYVYENYDESIFKKTSGQPIKGGALDGATVRFRPKDSRTAVSVNKDGDGGSALHLYFLGHSSRFYLKKVTDDTNASFSGYTTERNISDAYIIYNYHKERENRPNTGKMVAAEKSDNGASVHLENSFSADDANRNRFYWYLIPQYDGSYIIQNAKYPDRYWSLDNIDEPTKNDNELKSKSNAMKWDIEIISTVQYASNTNGAYDGESVPFEKAKNFDSYNVTNYGGATSLNWMTNLPDEVKLSDLNIPGTHDAATLNVDSYDSYHCQQLYIDDMLNVGVRHLDLRIHADNGTGFADDFKMVHGKHDCHNRNGSVLYLGNVWKWCTAFLDKNPGECLIFQIKEDNDNGGGGLMYKYFKMLASQPNSYIYNGTGMPTMEELRGKIYIVSRLEQNDAKWAVENDHERPEEASYSSDMLYSIDPYYGYTHPTASSKDVEKELAKKWAYDASSYKEYSTVYDPFGDEEQIYHAVYCTTINGVELWDFDDWKNHVSFKKNEIWYGLYRHDSLTLQKIRDAAKD